MASASLLLPRLAMINGTGAPNAGAVAFTITAANIGDAYSLVPATFRTGLPPPAGTPEYFLAVDSPASAGVSLTQVHAWRFHVDFVTPANSTFGAGPNHTPDANITVNAFVDAFTTTTTIVPQNGTVRLLDTLGDKLMTPLVYQNRAGTESLWASQTVNNNQGGTGPTAIRWYQFNVTGGTIPATAAQQQTFNNAADGLWRWMPSIAVDAQGNMAIGYAESSATTEPAIAYAGRLAGDPLNTLAQGEAIMQAGGGHQTSTSGRWGDYSALGIDPADNATFWHTHEYYSATSTSAWNTRIGKFKFPSGPVPQQAVSRRNHNGVNFDIPLPLTGNPGIECRRGTGAGFDGYQVIVTFANNVTVGGVTVTSSNGLATATRSVSGGVVTVDLSAVANAQTLGITLTNTNDGTATGDVPIPMGVLVGDTNGDRFVNAGDATQTRNRAGQTADATNFRSDVNADGLVNSGDTSRGAFALWHRAAITISRGEKRRDEFPASGDSSRKRLTILRILPRPKNPKMKKTSPTQSGFSKQRLVLGLAFCSISGLLAFLAFSGVPNALVTSSEKSTEDIPRYMPVPGEKADDLERIEMAWHDRLTYPTGRFDPAWVRQAAAQDALISRELPLGIKVENLLDSNGAPLVLNPNAFTALGPAPERMTGCSGCFDYGVTQGRVNAIVVDPTTTTNGSIVAYIGSVGGGVWKTTNCCSGSTNWTLLTNDPLISTTAIDTLAIDPNNHNVVYAGTGDLNFGSFSMGSQGILKTTDGGTTWTVLGASVFGPAYTEPAGQFPQYNAVGKVRVDPNNSSRVVAGTKKGLYFSYDGGVNWSGPCLTNAMTSQRQDITGLELSNMGGGVTRILAAVGTRGFATPVQPDLGLQGANGLYKGTMPASGCPSDFTLITRNDNGFVFGAAVTGSPYAAGAFMNAGSGVPYSSATVGTQLSRVDIAVAPSNPNYIYVQAGSIAGNSASGCGGGSGCQLGVWSSIDGGVLWNFMTGSAGGSLRSCASGGTSGSGSSATLGSGDYPQNWYDQGMVVDPNNPDRLFVDTFDTWLALRTGTQFYNITCGYSGSAVSNHVVHVDHHALAFVPGSSSILLEGSDGGIFGTANANAAQEATLRPTWFNMDTGLNTIEFYAGDISGNFANSASSIAVGGAQDNGPSSVTFPEVATGPVQWQMGLGGDGFSGQIDPVGTGTSLRVWEGNNSGGLSRCVSNCTNSGASWAAAAAVGPATNSHSFCRSISSTAAFPEGMTAGPRARPPAAATSSPARPECGKRLAARRRRCRLRPGM